MKILSKPHESYIIRHKILEFLFIKGNEEFDYQKPKKRYTILDISMATGIPKEKVNLYHEFLHEIKEIKCGRCRSSTCMHHMKITSDGRQAFINRKYIKEGNYERRNLIKDYSSIISPVISVLSLVVAIIAVSKSCTETPKESKIRLQIESKVPELKIQELKEVPSQPKSQGQ